MLRRSISWPLCNTCNLSLCSCCSLRGYLSNEKRTDANMHNQPRILLYILRRDVRLSDNPVFHFASRQINRGQNSALSSSSELRNRDDSFISEHGGAAFTHLLPVYVFSANQVESSGFLASPSDQCPYPEARSEVAKVWRTGPHRASFTAQGVWDLKRRLERLGCGSGLQVRVGLIEDVVRDILEFYAKRGDNETSNARVTGIWMTSDDGTEERHDEKLVEKLAVQYDVNFKVWEDTKFYVDECVLLTMTSSEIYQHRTNADELQS
jgi:deoxyribodipyrimidine photo-lyase